MDDEASVPAAAKSSAKKVETRKLLGVAEEWSDFEEGVSAVGRWAAGESVVKKTGMTPGKNKRFKNAKHKRSARLGAGKVHSELEPQIMAAYDSLGADAFYWFSALSKNVRSASSTDAFSSTLSVAMKDRIELLDRVQLDLGRKINKVEMARYVDSENEAYAAYFAFRTGVCR
jgi:phosphopantetheinyl transferase (holo-ACP synthase)